MLIYGDSRAIRYLLLRWSTCHCDLHKALLDLEVDSFETSCQKLSEEYCSYAQFPEDRAENTQNLPDMALKCFHRMVVAVIVGLSPPSPSFSSFGYQPAKFRFPTPKTKAHKRFPFGVNSFLWCHPVRKCNQMRIIISMPNPSLYFSAYPFWLMLGVCTSLFLSHFAVSSLFVFLSFCLFHVRFFCNCQLVVYLVLFLFSFVFFTYPLFQGI